jgi:AraC-like DNA-binding protein
VKFSPPLQRSLHRALVISNPAGYAPLTGSLRRPFENGLRRVAWLKKRECIPMHLAVTFRRFHGCSIGEYLRRRRVAQVREILAHSQQPLSDIAIEAGFTDESHMSRTFRRFSRAAHPTEVRQRRSQRDSKPSTRGRNWGTRFHWTSRGSDFCGSGLGERKQKNCRRYPRAD